MNDIPENVKVVLKSTMPFLIVVALFIIVGKIGIGKAKDIQVQTEVSKTTQNTLTQKINIIQSLSASLSGFSSSAAVALPDSNTSLAVISQLKNLANFNGLVVSDIKSSSALNNPSGLSSVGVDVNVIGNKDQVKTFLESIQTIAPISIVDKVKINENAGSTQASVSVKSFWAVLPAALPTTNQTLTGLSTDEQKLLDSVNALTPPAFGVLPAASGGKDNPFQ